MRSQVAVTWNDSRTYRIDLEEVQPIPHEQARVWLDQQFTELDCEPIRQSGKVLTAFATQNTASGRFRSPVRPVQPWPSPWSRWT